MQFLIMGYDSKDSKALQRRLDAREAHLALGDKLKAQGHLLYAAAILNEEEKMAGSVLICDFDSPDEVDAWLKVEPYVTGKVWDKVQVARCKVGPSFLPKP